MLKYVDVSADPKAPKRARLSEKTVSEALGAGFVHDGWVASIFDGGGRPIITGIYVHPNGRMLLEMSSHPFDASGLKTLLSDGTMVMTETMPPKRDWEMTRRGIFPPKEHRIDMAVFDVSSLAALVEKHEERVRAHEARGLEVAPSHDKRTCFAMKLRWREVSDPRMKRQLEIALWMGGGAMIAVMAGVAAAALIFSQHAAAILLLVLIAPPIGIAVFRWALIVVAPGLAKGAPAPAPRPPAELMTLADRVEIGSLPSS